MHCCFFSSPIFFSKYHAIFERDQENDLDGDADEEGGETADPDTHYLEGLEEEEEGEGEEGVSPVDHILATTTTAGDGYGVAL